jgi:redox-sensitive bicupin YhaK (pirin superfamily)
LFYVHSTLAAGARERLPDGVAERAAYVIEGEVEAEGRAFQAGQLLVFGAGSAVLEARTRATLMLLGGEPLGERFIDWNFVSSSKARIEQAKADWRAGRMKLPDLDCGEFIPLP